MRGSRPVPERSRSSCGFEAPKTRHEFGNGLSLQPSASSVPVPFGTENWEFPESLTEEIGQAFCNVERTLASAGAGWEHLIQVNSYPVGFTDEVNKAMTERFRQSLRGTPGLWNALLSGVQARTPQSDCPRHRSPAQ